MNKIFISIKQTYNPLWTWPKFSLLFFGAFIACRTSKLSPALKWLSAVLTICLPNPSCTFFGASNVEYYSYFRKWIQYLLKAWDIANVSPEWEASCFGVCFEHHNDPFKNWNVFNVKVIPQWVSEHLKHPFSINSFEFE